MSTGFHQRPDSPGAVPSRLADILHPGSLDEIGRGVARLHRCCHPKRRESRQIVGVEALDVDDSVTTILCRIGHRGGFDGVEREPDSSVTSGMSVRLEAEPVELRDDLAQFADRCRGVSTVARPVGVVVQHPRGVRLDDIIGIELDRPEAETVSSWGIVDCGSQVLAKFRCGIDRVEESGDDPRREPVLTQCSFEQPDLRNRNLRFDDGGDA
ncbi:Uncharacterised protein [Mycobacteroides abscessus subsp. abscessus]|nr:Uncharacterised protein [Mycobacteroides abscessus subsp. abscessus]